MARIIVKRYIDDDDKDKNDVYHIYTNIGHKSKDVDIDVDNDVNKNETNF